MANDANNLVTITDPQEDRYASLHLINWWRQERIQAARIMVVGAGALGNEVLKNLALLGVGHIFISDFDIIEVSNLTRSVLFRSEDRGQLKARIAAKRVQALNPDIKVIPFHGDITRELGAGVFRRMDVVISCLDNRAARMAVNSACWNVNVPWVDGALDVQDGLIRVFIPPDSACYECTMTEQDYALLGLRYSCQPGFTPVSGRQPTMPTTASLIAAMQVQEAIKLLHRQIVPAGQAVYYSWQSLRLNSMSYPRRQDCPAHTTFERIISLPYCVNDLTTGQLGDVIRPFIEADGIVYLPHDVVTSFYCPVCKSEEAVHRPFYLVVPERVTCPHCATARVFDVTSTFSTRSAQKQIPLSQLGIPALHILPVRSGTDWQYFELSNDEQYVLATW